LDTEGTQVVNDDESWPTFTGLVIISSVIVIVTLSTFSTPAATSAPIVQQTASPPNSDPDCNSGFNPDRLRIIAELDFSQKDQDVWNALGVAIVAMQIRKAALKANYALSSDESDAVAGQGETLARSRIEDDLGETLDSSRLELEDDPDL
jgi:hypothetical protein